MAWRKVQTPKIPQTISWKASLIQSRKGFCLPVSRTQNSQPSQAKHAIKACYYTASVKVQFSCLPVGQNCITCRSTKLHSFVRGQCLGLVAKNIEKLGFLLSPTIRGPALPVVFINMGISPRKKPNLRSAK